MSWAARGRQRHRYAVTSERIIRELAMIGFGNIDDFVAVQADGSLVVDFGTATREQMASLKSIELDERMIGGAAAGVRKVKISMSDKRQALMDLAKIARMLPADRQEHSGPGGGPIAFDVGVKEEHKIDIEAMSPEEREQLRQTLLTGVAATPLANRHERMLGLVLVYQDTVWNRTQELPPMPRATSTPAQAAMSICTAGPARGPADAADWLWFEFSAAWWSYFIRP